MEKISQIVRGNSRVSSADLKNAAPVRPGAPSFGRPVGESTAVSHSPVSTAARAAALHAEITEQRRAHGPDKIVQQMSDQFFMSRIRRPEEDVETVSPDARMEAEMAEAPEMEEPVEYTPRGSYIDVRA